MRKYDLNYFVEQEHAGTIFAKITKSNNRINANGVYFNYKEWIGKVISFSKADLHGASTIEPLGIAAGYLHYGDQLTIVNFAELSRRELDGRFEGWDGNKSYTYDVSHVYVQQILNLKDLKTIDFIIEHAGHSIFEDSYNVAACHLKSHGCEEAAAYLINLYKNR